MKKNLKNRLGCNLAVKRTDTLRFMLYMVLLTLGPVGCDGNAEAKHRQQAELIKDQVGIPLKRNIDAMFQAKGVYPETITEIAVRLSRVFYAEQFRTLTAFVSRTMPS